MGAIKFERTRIHFHRGGGCVSSLFSTTTTTTAKMSCTCRVVESVIVVVLVVLSFNSRFSKLAHLNTKIWLSWKRKNLTIIFLYAVNDEWSPSFYTKGTVAAGNESRKYCDNLEFNKSTTVLQGLNSYRRVKNSSYCINKKNCHSITSFSSSVLLSTLALDQSVREKSVSYCKWLFGFARIFRSSRMAFSVHLEGN